MSRKLDPEKALYLKPNQRTIPDRKRRKARGSAGEWVEHRGNSALDEWGVAIRVMRKLGKSF